MTFDATADEFAAVVVIMQSLKGLKHMLRKLKHDVAVMIIYKMQNWMSRCCCCYFTFWSEDKPLVGASCASFCFMRMAAAL